MPDLPELPSLSPLVLALAFLAIGAAAWLLGRHAVRSRTVRLPRDYYVGLDHLINDRFDRAVEVFARVAESGEDAAEIQFALGSLFRRRGEVDRAIAIHERLRGEAIPAVRNQATFALGLDYLSAGLMDRAERLFEELAATREYRREAIEHLLRIYEQQGDWANALKAFHDLPRELQYERRRVAAHYLCELAELAIVQGDMERARTLLREASARDDALPRARLLAGRMAEREGDGRAAVELYSQALEAAPGLALELIPRLTELSTRLTDPGILDEACARLRRTGRLTGAQLAWLIATALPAEGAGQLQRISGESLGAGIAPSLGALLARIGDAGGRYQCSECGLTSVGWFWRCPKCRAWEGMHPAVFKWAERSEEAVRGR